MDSRLKSLLIDGAWSITDRGIILLVQSQSELERLILDGEGLSSHTFVFVLRKLLKLEIIEVSFAENISNESFTRLGGDSVRQDGTNCLSKLKGFKLRKLGNSDISTSILNTHFLCEFSSSLTKLIMTDCESLDNSSLEVISKNCPNLEVAGFDWCITITDKGIEFLLDRCLHIRSLLLAGLSRLDGVWLPTVEKRIPDIKHIDFSMCDSIPDAEILGLIKRIVGISVVAYYGHILTSLNVDEYQLSERGNLC